jgi:hypothetical protein
MGERVKEAYFLGFQLCSFSRNRSFLFSGPALSLGQGEMAGGPSQKGTYRYPRTRVPTTDGTRRGLVWQPVATWEGAKQPDLESGSSRQSYRSLGRFPGLCPVGPTRCHEVS